MEGLGELKKNRWNFTTGFQPHTHMTSSTTSYSVDNYKDGSLIIDVVDAKTNKLIWQGTGNKEIDKPAKDPDTAIPKAISSIMSSFPPGKTKK